MIFYFIVATMNCYLYKQDVVALCSYLSAGIVETARSATASVTPHYGDENAEISIPGFRFGSNCSFKNCSFVLKDENK